MENSYEKKVMGKWDYLGDASGQIGLSIMMLTVSQLTYFYTDKVGLAAGVVGVYLTVEKFLEAITGIFLGDMVDKSNLGKNKYTAWMGRLIIPAAIAFILLFTVPTSFGQQVSGIYVLITNILVMAVISNLIATPYASLQVVRTKNQGERSLIGTFRSVASYLCGMIVTIGIIPITNMLGGNRFAWLKFGVGAAIIIMLTLSICYFSSRNKALMEIPIDEKKQESLKRDSIVKNLLKLVRNKYWVMVFFINIFLQINFTLSDMSGVYYMKWIFGDDNLVAVVGGMALIPTILGFIVSTPLVKKFGVMVTMRATALIWIAALLVKALIPANLPIFMVSSVISTFASIPAMTQMGVMSAMAIDYNEYLYGENLVTLTNGAVGMGNKLGGALATMLLSGSLAVAGYSSQMTVVSTASRYAIYAFSNWIPLISAVCVLLVYLKFDIEKKLPLLQKKAANQEN
ncbi:MAG: MFS transporter [Liquorilactobacillus nagelii]|uniref:MFS transporter n=1 Tax=Liquorilactobacillus nagelii TaxID=82688 RepID=UPI0039ECB51A